MFEPGITSTFAPRTKARVVCQTGDYPMFTSRDARGGIRPAGLRHRQAGLGRMSSGTEHKVLTVLFVDIRGSMALSGSVALDEWWTVLADLFELMCEGVCRFGGWVGNFTGDGVQAVFETPGRDVEHARRACDAALWLRDSLREATAQLERQRRLELEVRIGINSGEVLTGTIGERYSRHYTACGYTVALAKRMETLARPGGIYLTEHTAALIGQALELSDLGLFEVKGALSPVGVFELIGPRQERGVESLRVAVQGELPHRFTASRVAAAGTRSG